MLGRAEIDDDPRCKELRELNAQMLGAYRKQQWDATKTLIERCRKLERIEAYQHDPPPPDWNGVYEAEWK